MLRNPGQRGTQGIAELRYNVRGVSTVPSDCVDEIGPSRLRKKKLGQLARPTVKLSVKVLPRNRLAAVRVETRKPTVEFGLVGRGQQHVSG